MDNDDIWLKLVNVLETKRYDLVRAQWSTKYKMGVWFKNNKDVVRSVRVTLDLAYLLALLFSDSAFIKDFARKRHHSGEIA